MKKNEVLALKQRIRKLESLLRSVYSWVAHDIRRPLAVINNSNYALKVFRERGDTRERLHKKYNGQISREVMRAARVITRVTDRIETAGVVKRVTDDRGKFHFERLTLKELHKWRIVWKRHAPHLLRDRKDEVIRAIDEEIAKRGTDAG